MISSESAYRVLIVCLMVISTVFFSEAQVLSLEDYNCRYDEVLQAYMKKDSIKEIKSIEVLGHMADCAQIEDIGSVDSLCNRILKLSTDYSNPFVAKAIYYKYYPKKITAVWDSLITEVEKTDVRNGDVIRLLNMGRIAAQITPTNPNCEGVDSVLLSIVNGIEDVTHYYYAITGSLQMLSICASRRGESDLAISYEQQRGQITEQYYASCARQKGSAFVSLGRRYQAAGKLDSAEFYFRKSKEFFMTYRPDVPEDYIMASVNIASCLDEQGYHLKMIEELKSAERIAYSEEKKGYTESLSPDVSSSIGIVYNLLGQAYQELGSEKSAIKYFQKSMAVVEDGSDQPTIQKLVAYANVGENLAILGKEDLAGPYLFKSLDFAEKLVGRKHYFTAVILMNIGNMEYQLGNFDDCKKYYDQSLEIRKSIYGEDHQSLANVYVNYTKLFESMSKDDLIEEYYDKALKIYNKTYGSRHPLIAGALLKKANYYVAENKNEEALAVLNEGEHALGYVDDYTEVANLKTFLEIQFLRSNIVYDQWAKNQERDEQDVILSFKKAEEVLEFSLSATDDLQDRASLAGKSKSFFDAYGLALLHLADEGVSDSLLYKSLAVSDRGKNQGLLFQLENHANIITANLPKEYLVEKKEALSRLAELNFKRDKAIVGSDRFLALVDSINILDDRLAASEEGMSTTFPIMNNIRVGTEDVDIRDVQNGLSTKQVLLAISKVKNRIICHYLYHDLLDYQILEVPEGFDMDITDYLGKIGNRVEGIQKNAKSFELVNQIFSDLREDIESVVVIPDGPFLQFPFELLETDEGFLIEKYAISYANSLNVLMRQVNKVDAEMSYSFTGFAPSYNEYESDSEELPIIASLLRNGNWSLPFAQKEVEGIQNIIGGNLFVGEDAKKVKFLQAIEKRDVIHMSMHALMDTKSPLNSRLLFGSEEDDNEDLLLYELYNVHAKSPLVVLSACETGAGAYDKSDGVQSLANGFLFAGVPSTVMSLWKVPDESTSQIMVSFYKHLNEGKRKDESLRLAKMEYLDNAVSDKQKHPFYWAGFVVVGDTSPITFAAGFDLWLTVIPAGILLLLLIYFVKTKSVKLT